jgi:hypothetical protein
MKNEQESTYKMREKGPKRENGKTGRWGKRENGTLLTN